MKVKAAILLGVFVYSVSYGATKPQSSYTVKETPAVTDKALISDPTDGNKTKNATLGSFPISIAVQDALDGKPSSSAFASAEAFYTAFGWSPSGSMTYPDAGIPNSTGSAWGASYVLDTDASNVSANHDSVFSAKAVNDAYAKKEGISFIAGALDDLKILTTAQPTDGENLIDDALNYGATDDHLRLWSIDKVGQQLALKLDATASEINGSATTTLTAAQVSGTIVSNYGQEASDVALTLPIPAPGYNVLFTVGQPSPNKWGVRAGTTDKIYLLDTGGGITAGEDNGYARMTTAQIGQAFACWTFQTGTSNWDWACKAISTGTSTFAAD